MRWSTEKFAKDILLISKSCNISVKKALKTINLQQSGIFVYWSVRHNTWDYCRWECPINQIIDEFPLQKGINRESWLNQSTLWQEGSYKINDRRIKKVKQWFKKNGYLK